MKRRLAGVLLSYLVATIAQGTHIIGGEMYYDHLGGNQYRVTMDLYRDCSPANQNGTGFDLQVEIGVFNSAGTFLFSQFVTDPGEDLVPVIISNPCLSAPPNVCIATTRYQAIFNLPPLAGGYTLSYQRCCRTPAIVNLANPGQQGLTCTITVPGPPTNANGSPRFDAYPPVVLCVGQDMVIDHSATDPDGDVLVYELCTPYHGASNTNPAPPPAPPPYTPVPWGGGYSMGYQVDSSPPMAIDAVTGVLTVHPTQIGIYAVGVCVKEFRNGSLIGETRRDFMFNVVACDPNIVSIIAAQTPGQLCEGLTQTFGNESINGQFWHWDFGVAGTAADTSDLDSPTWTYAQPGSYAVTLIANPGWPCADTNTVVYEVSLPVTVSFDPPGALCGAAQVTLTAEGAFTSDAVLSWDLGPGATPTTGTGTTISATFQPLGSQSVTVSVLDNGCTAEFTGTVPVFPIPQPAIGPQQSFCSGLSVSFTNNSTGATDYAWDFGDPSTSSDVSTAISPVWNYADQGIYTVTLVADPAGPCPASTTQVFNVFTTTDPSFVVPPIRCPGQPADLQVTGNFSPAASVVWDAGVDGAISSVQGASATVVFQQLGGNAVTVTVFENGCEGTFTDSVIVHPFPVADFSSDSRSCVGAVFGFQDLSEAWTPMSHVWEFGDGATSTEASPMHQYEDPGSYDVTLTVSTSSGCIASHTVTRPSQVEVFANPVAGFSALPREVSVFDPRIEVIDASQDAVSWTYTIDGRTIHDPSFSYTFADGGQYIITQEVENEHGCTDLTSLMVVVSDHIFHAPNAFSPDGDGLNDEWLPVVLGARHYELVIHDRWGRDLFRTDDPRQGWSGDGLPQGVFSYTARIKEWGAYAREYAGHFTLIR